jgi:nitrogen fixation NifU-like protein
MEEPDGEGFMHNPVCGDRMRVWIKVEDGHVAEVRWQTKGCPAAIATSSVTSEMVRGWSLDRVKGLTREEISEAVGGLPKDKMHCSVLAGDALRLAIADYKAKALGPGDKPVGAAPPRL